MTMTLSSFPQGGAAIIIGSSGGIGSALLEALHASARFDAVIGLSRTSEPSIDLAEESTIAAAAEHVAGLQVPVRLVVVASGILQGQGIAPEKTWRHLDAAAMQRSFLVNAIGPALVAKHFLPLLPREGKAVFAAISAKVGSIGDNRLGGWYSYRASKAALNQLLRTAAIELSRTRPDAICATLHPGTVATPLSQPFRGSAPSVVDPDEAAVRLLHVIDRLTPEQTGRLVDHSGEILPY
ncbi:SDR family oxidoreductase [Devosia pacifica]|uniref:SDR family oxidoreductase n=1 Tax=Devosia pacifica TaxID=1335967 RepID=A0A918S7Y5_9HYPH|nr:SDR family NAD(P)-dependent oxidoreductase [Devosia pacifica]GHA27946.1 SDR family oxidoreductase [Devosia pacifica]